MVKNWNFHYRAQYTSQYTAINTWAKWLAWKALALGVILLFSYSCSNQMPDDIHESLEPGSIRSEPDPVLLEPKLMVGQYIYPNSSPVYQGFPFEWLPLTQTTESWYVLAGPGVLLIDGTRVQAFDSSVIDPLSGMMSSSSKNSDLLFWEMNLPKTPVTAPLVSGDTMVWALPGLGLMGIDRATGQIMWEQAMPGVFPVVHLFEGSLFTERTMENTRFYDYGLVLVSDRLEGLSIIDSITGKVVAGPFQQVTGQVVVLENNGLILATQPERFTDMSEDQFILSSLLPLSLGPSVQVFQLYQRNTMESSQPEWNLQAHGTAVGGAIHPSGRGVLIYTVLGARRIEARHVTVNNTDSEEPVNISSRVIWTGNNQIGLTQAVRIQAALDSRAGVWPLVVVSDNDQVKLIHGGVGTEIGAFPLQPIREHLGVSWLSEINDEEDPSNQELTFALGTILVPGVRSDRLIGLRPLVLPGNPSQINPLIWSNQLRLITPWGMYGAQFAHQDHEPLADLDQPIIHDQNPPHDLNVLRPNLAFLEFIQRAGTEEEPLIWNIQDGRRIQVGFPAQISPLHISLVGQESGTFFYQNTDSEVSPLLIQVYNQDHMIYTNATHVSLDTQGRFELSESQGYVIQVSWAQGDESITYGIGRFLFEKQ